MKIRTVTIFAWILVLLAWSYPLFAQQGSPQVPSGPQSGGSFGAGRPYHARRGRLQNHELSSGEADSQSL